MLFASTHDRYGDAASTIAAIIIYFIAASCLHVDVDITILVNVVYVVYGVPILYRAAAKAGSEY